MVSFRQIICLIFLLGIISVHDILHDLCSAFISSDANLLFSVLVHLQTSDIYNTMLFVIMLCMYCTSLSYIFSYATIFRSIIFCILPLSSSFSDLFFIMSILSYSHA
jgi:hypothetical protein